MEIERKFLVADIRGDLTLLTIKSAGDRTRVEEIELDLFEGGLEKLVVAGMPR